MQVDKDKLKTDNSSLMGALREKSRKQQQTQELYDRLKRKEMTAATQSAAYDSVDDVLQSTSRSTDSQLRHAMGGMHQYPREHNSANIRGGHHRYESNNSGSGSGSGRMMPPPLPRNSQAFSNQPFRFRKVMGLNYE